MTRVELVIEELVLHGVSPLERHAVSDAIEGELRRLLETRRSWHSVGEANLESVTVRDVQLHGGLHLALGAAAAIHQVVSGAHRHVSGVHRPTSGAHQPSLGAYQPESGAHQPASGAKR